MSYFSSRWAAPAGALTLAAQVAAFGLNGTWADFQTENAAGMWANSNGTGAVTDGTTANKWEKSDGNNFNAAFTNASASGLIYRANVNGAPCLEGYSDGSPTQRWLNLDSTTAMNGTYTLLLRFNAIQESVAAYFMSHNSAVHAIHVATNGFVTFRTSSVLSNPQMTGVHQSTPTTATTFEVRSGMTVIGTGHNNTAINFGRRSSGTSHSGCGLRRAVIIMGTVTAAQQMTLLSLM